MTLVINFQRKKRKEEKKEKILPGLSEAKVSFVFSGIGNLPEMVVISYWPENLFKCLWFSTLFSSDFWTNIIKILCQQ